MIFFVPITSWFPKKMHHFLHPPLKRGGGRPIFFGLPPCKVFWHCRLIWGGLLLSISLNWLLIRLIFLRALVLPGSVLTGLGNDAPLTGCAHCAVGPAESPPIPKPTRSGPPPCSTQFKECISLHTYGCPPPLMPAKNQGWVSSISTNFILTNYQWLPV